MANNPARKPLFHRFGYLLIMGISAKLLIDTTMQMFNPFLAIIGSGIGVGAVVMGRIVALRNLAGLAAPLLGTLADRVGYRTVMRISLLAAGIGMILSALSGNIFFFALFMVLSGLGQVGFTPNLHAYLSTRLPYDKRARGLGMIEYSWALAGMVGLFISGYLIEIWSWKAPFFVIGSALIVMALVYSTLPANVPPAVTREKIPFPQRVIRLFDLGSHAASAWGCILVTGLSMFAAMHVMIIHGSWLQTEYNLSPSKLGSVAFLLGAFDLLASVTVSIAVDKIGKRKSVIIGVTGMMIGFFMLPFLNRGLILALVGIVIPRSFFEFAVVSNFPLLSEQSPEQRGKIMSLSLSFGLIGTTLAGITGPSSYLRYGVWGLGPVSLAASAAALLILLFIVKEQPYKIKQ